MYIELGCGDNSVDERAFAVQTRGLEPGAKDSHKSQTLVCTHSADSQRHTDSPKLTGQPFYLSP